MKRIDMVEALANLLCQNPEPTKDMYTKYYNDADSILNFLEDMGMQPPKITIMKDSYNRTAGTYGFETNEWEQ